MNNENTFFYILLAVVVIGFAIPFVQAYYYKNKSRGVARKPVAKVAGCTDEHVMQRFGEGSNYGGFMTHDPVFKHSPTNDFFDHPLE
jgi:hypothetical protein